LLVDSSSARADVDTAHAHAAVIASKVSEIRVIEFSN
jgi:hypothetical protein